MRAFVVYQSLWGNTAAVARAIAEGIGNGAVAGHTGEISPTDAGTADLLVVGSPVHAFGLPSKATVSSVHDRGLAPGDLPPSLDIPLVRDWLAALESAPQAAGAFDTRVTGPFGRGGVGSIERILKSKGRRLLLRGEGFVIINQKSVSEAGSMLREGELARATEWGTELASLM